MSHPHRPEPLSESNSPRKAAFSRARNAVHPPTPCFRGLATFLAPSTSSLSRPSRRANRERKSQTPLGVRERESLPVAACAPPLSCHHNFISDQRTRVRVGVRVPAGSNAQQWLSTGPRVCTAQKRVSDVRCVPYAVHTVNSGNKNQR